MDNNNDINFRTLFYEIDMGVYICDLEGFFLYGNLNLAETLGFQKAEKIIGENIRQFFSADQGKAYNNRLFRSIFSAKRQESITTKIVKPDGTHAHIEIRYMPFIQNGVLLGSQGVIFDITKHKQSEELADYLSTQDPDTGLFNRNFFEAEMSRLERGRHFPISIALVSLEILQKEDRTASPEIAKKQIKRFAHMLFQSYRGDDIIARTGEYEFAILLPGVNAATAKNILSRIKRRLLKLITNDMDEPFRFYLITNTGEKEDSLKSVFLRTKELMILEKKRGDKPAE